MSPDLIEKIASATSCAQMRLLIDISGQRVTTKDLCEITAKLDMALALAPGNELEKCALDAFDAFVQLLDEDPKINKAASSIGLVKEVRNKLKYASISTRRRDILRVQELSKLLWIACIRLNEKARDEKA